MADELKVRFRHTTGTDIGPYNFQDSATVQQVKEKLLSEWPKGARATGFLPSWCGLRGHP